MSLLPLPKPRAGEPPCCSPRCGHSSDAPPPQCLTPTNEWSWVLQWWEETLTMLGLG